MQHSTVLAEMGSLAVRSPTRRLAPPPSLSVEGIPSLYTVAEAARLLTVSPSYVRKLLDLRLLQCVDMGSGGRRIPRFTLAELQRFVDQRSRPTSPCSALEEPPDAADRQGMTPTRDNRPSHVADKKGQNR